MSSFFQALDEGYTPEQVLGYLAKALPNFSPMIRKAQRSGYPAQQILGFLTKSFETEDRTGMSESERHAVNKRADAERAKYGLKVAATAVAAPLAGMAARAALSRALPSTLQAFGGQSPPSNNPLNPSGGNPSGTASAPIPGAPQGQTQLPPASSQPPISQPTIPQTPTPAQPEVKTINVADLLNKNNLTRHVDELAKKQKDPSAIAAILYNKFPDEMGALQKQGGKPMEDLIGEYISQKQPEVSEKLNNQEIKSPEIEKSEEKQPLISKGSTVASPKGVGEIKEIRNGKAIVEVDGKKHQVDEADLEQEPEEIKSLDLEGAVSDYLSRIPEGEKSSVIDVSLFDPSTQELQVRFPNGDQWVYGPIPEEIFERINSMTGIPVSSGESKLRGTIWEKGVSNSAGADFFKLVKKLVKEGVIKERKLKTGIDLFKGFNRVKKRK